MKIIIGGFAEETNSFSLPVGRERVIRYRGEDVFGFAAFRGIADVLKEKGWDFVPACSHELGAAGTMADEIAEDFLDEFLADLDANQPFDGIFMYIHGGMQFAGHDDGCGYLLKRIREHVGPEPVIAVSSDMHGNLTPESMKYLNVATAMQHYPHTDLYEIGVRAARQGIMIMEGKPLAQALVRIPMIVPAEGYNSEFGPFKEQVLDYGHTLVQKGTILDFSVYQMQPWLDTGAAGSGVLVSAKDQDTAAACAKELARRLFRIRAQMKVDLYDIDAVFDAARANTTGKTVILVDSADSSNAGASADSSFVLERYLDRHETMKMCMHISDRTAAERAWELGVGTEDDFDLGGYYEPLFHHPLRVRAYVKALYDGDYLLSDKKWMMHVGKSAVLQAGNVDIVLHTRMRVTSDTRCYRAFGIEPSQYDIAVVKSANDYKAYYREFTDLFYPTDTPGAASANLKAMPFQRIPRPFYPFDDIEDFDDTAVFAAGGRS